MAWLFGSSKSSRSDRASSSARRSLDEHNDARRPKERSKSKTERDAPRSHRSKSDGHTANELKSRRSSGKSKKHVSEEHVECSVCFEALCDAPTAVFVGPSMRNDPTSQKKSKSKKSSTNRTCADFFHFDCAKCLLARNFRECPVCRAAFTDVLPVPDPSEDPDGWFTCVDLNGDGRLSPGEIVEVLRAQIPCDWRAIEKDVMRRDSGSNGKGKTQTPKKNLFDRWDPDGDGFVEKFEMVMPGGLLEYVVRKFPKRKHQEKALETARSLSSSRTAPMASSHFSTSNPPVLAKHPSAWFKFWDTDKSGTLDKEEVTRALVKTLRFERESEHREFTQFGELMPPRSSTTYGRNSYGRLLTDVATARAVRNVVDAIWPVFDLDGNGAVDKHEFLKPDGLAEAIVANIGDGLGIGASTSTSPNRISRTQSAPGRGSHW